MVESVAEVVWSGLEFEPFGLGARTGSERLLCAALSWFMWIDSGEFWRSLLGEALPTGLLAQGFLALYRGWVELPVHFVGRVGLVCAGLAACRGFEVGKHRK